MQIQELHCSNHKHIKLLRSNNIWNVYRDFSFVMIYNARIQFYDDKCTFDVYVIVKMLNTTLYYEITGRVVFTMR
jgi:hypothetical protein